MKRPAIYGLIFLALGIIGNYYISVGIFFVLFMISVIVFACLICEKWGKSQYRIVYTLFFLLGFTICFLRLQPKDSIAENIMLSQETVFIRGVITESGFTATGRRKIVLSADHMQSNSYETDKKVNILIYTDFEEELLPGTEITVRGLLLAPSHLRNPGGFNEYLYFMSRKLDYKMNGSIIAVGETNVNIQTLFYLTRYNLSQVYDRVLPSAESAIAKSLILGDRSDLETHTVTLYKGAGIYHLIAISGLHISVIGEVFKKIFTKLTGYRNGLILTSALIAVYCMFTGGAVSTVRATVMMIVSAAGFFLMKEYDMLSAASFTAILLLIYEPFYLFDMGFQLSFACVFGIGFLNKPLFQWVSTQKFYKRKYDFAAGNLCISLAISISTLPIIVAYLNKIPVYSVIVNLLVVPLCSVVLVLGFITGLVGLISIDIGFFFAATVYYLLKYFEYVCTFFTTLPFSQILVASQPVLIIIIYYLALWAVVIRFGTKKIRRSLWAGFAVVFLLWNMRPSPFTITMLDVGQGDCFVIENGYETFVIDGGGWFGRDIGESTGVNVLVPYLDYKGIKNIDAAFITHLDRDHYMGIFELIIEKNVKQVILPISADIESEEYKTLVHLSENNGTKIVFFQHGTIFKTKSKIKFETLHPFMYNSTKDINDESLVMMLEYGQFKMLFTGDIGFQPERHMVESGLELYAHVLKAGHHGSRYSSSKEFMDQVEPMATFISAGINNIYGHPHKEAVERIEDVGSAIYLTADRGAVMLRYNKKGVFKVIPMIGEKQVK